MKKLVTILTFVLIVCCALFAACAPDEDSEVEVTGIELDVTQITLIEGDEWTLTATITPANATDKTVEWLSSNYGVVAVEDGRVFAISEGEAIITVLSANGKSATCSVTVEAKQESVTEHVVTYNARGGKFDNGNSEYVVHVNDGDKLTSLTVTRDKYNFTGWYKDYDRTGLWDFDNDTVDDNIAVYAGWEYISDYKSVTDALAARIGSERNDGDLNEDVKLEILSVYTDNGFLCFVEREGEDVFTYKTDICGFEQITGNEDIVSQIPDTNLTQLEEYNDTYTLYNNSRIVDSMVLKYANDYGGEESIEYTLIYGCVSEWEKDTVHITTGDFYSCKIKALIADDGGNVFTYCATVVSGVADFDYVIGGTALSGEYDEAFTALGETANDFYAEYVKGLEA